MPTTETIHGLIHVTYSKEDWKTFGSPEKVSGILDHTFELPPPGQPPLKEGHVYSFKNYIHKDRPADLRGRLEQTYSSTIEARQEAIATYDDLKAQVESQIETQGRTRQELADKLASLPLDEDHMELREQLNGFIRRLDRALTAAQERLTNLVQNYGPDGVYRKDIAADIPSWLPSGKILNDKLILQYHKSETADEIIDRVGDLYVDLKSKLANFPADADKAMREELDDYVRICKAIIEGAKKRLVEEFGWEDSKAEAALIPPISNTSDPALVNELAETDPVVREEAFLAAMANLQENWSQGPADNPVDLLEHYLRMIDRSAAATQARLKPLPEPSYDYGTFSGTLSKAPDSEPPAARVEQESLNRALAAVEEALAAAA
jgi:hypothetical protein